MSYQSQDTTGRDALFRAQVRQAIIAQAVVVAVESSGTTNHAARVTLGSQLLRSLTEDQLFQWSWAVVSDGTTVPGATDAALLTRVANLWNAFAGGT